MLKGFWDNLKKSPSKKPVDKVPPPPSDGGISRSLQENITYLKRISGTMTDLVFREIQGLPKQAVLLFLVSISDKNQINDNIIKPLINRDTTVSMPMKQIIENNVTISEFDILDTMDGLFGALMKGKSILLTDGSGVVYAFSTDKNPSRQVSEPSTESVIRGTKTGFVENIKINMGLVRNICRDPNLKFETLQIGRRTKTDIVISYIAGIVKDDLIEEVRNRLKKIDTDRVMDSGELTQYLNDNPLSPFPQVNSTERLDRFSAGLMDGKVGIIIGNSPFSLIVPVSLHILLASPEDYYENWVVSSVIRATRYLAFLMSMTLPALYIALISFNVGLLPRDLVFTIGGAREGIPFPAFIEAIMMEAGVEFLHEASVRLPKNVGQTVGVVGGLILGEAAVRAGIVSPAMVIVIALTAIASFIVPSYSLSLASRIVRVPLMILAAIFGLFGFVMGLIILFVHLVALTSFSEGYMAPWGQSGMDSIKDTFIRAPLKLLKKRPEYLGPEDTVRQKAPDDGKSWW